MAFIGEDLDNIHEYFGDAYGLDRSMKSEYKMHLFNLILRAPKTLVK